MILSRVEVNKALIGCSKEFVVETYIKFPKTGYVREADTLILRYLIDGTLWARTNEATTIVTFVEVRPYGIKRNTLPQYEEI